MSNRFRQVLIACALALVATLALASTAGEAATPPGGALNPDANGKAATAWTGTVNPGTATGAVDGIQCFNPVTGQPNPASGCDFYNLDVNVDPAFWKSHRGGATVGLSGWSAPNDIDLYVYTRNADGSAGDFVNSSGNSLGDPESLGIPNASGKYLVVAVAYSVAPGTTYKGSATLAASSIAGIPELQKKAEPPAGPNYRASHDQYISHSEPTIAMDPLNPDHLMAGSKMYEDLPHYLFKIGTYESFDGGRTWEDQGHLQNYCEAPGQCNPKDLKNYRTTSDITMSFDDEGNTYANVLDAPGGGAASNHGYNMTVHIKHPGQPWSKYIVVHDNRNNPVTNKALLDDKNWIVVDNKTTTDGSPNKPHDGKIGTMYVCWGLDQGQPPEVPTPPDPAFYPAVGQSIVVMKSTDAGKTWGGIAPGDNTPYRLSQKQTVAGIGCHLIVGPHGEVYATWYDNQLNMLFQAKSTNRGQTWSEAYPIAQITGIPSPFDNSSFRNLSLPTSAIDSKGNLYVAVSSVNGSGSPVVSGAAELGRKIAEGKVSARDVAKSLESTAHAAAGGGEEADQGQDTKDGSGADIILFKSTDGGNSWTGPVRVNQDNPKADTDQFQPWMAVTPKGQVDISYFDRRNDPGNFFIDTYLSRSNDGGKTFKDVRASQMMWDPSINPPISASGQFIGDYQGLVANDDVAIPFWNDTQAANRPKSDPLYSPWQEVWDARIPNGAAFGGPKGCLDRVRPRSKFKNHKLRRLRARKFRLRGTASDASKCKSKKPGVRTVLVAVGRQVGGKKHCRFLQSSGKFGPKVACSRPFYLRARGTKKWSFRVKKRLPRGRYVIYTHSIDRNGNIETKKRRKGHGRNYLLVRVR